MTDLDKLQGTWNVTALEVDGNPMPCPGGARIVIEGSSFQSLGMGAVYGGTVEMDERKNARKTPKHFDMVFTEGPERGNRSLGIYELKGDVWKICITVTAVNRPKEFATKEGSGLALETLTRGAAVPMEPPTEETSASTPLPAAHTDPAPEIEGEWQMTACNADGFPVPESMVKTGRRVARDGETESYFGKQRIMKARYAVDRSVSPHAIDYTLDKGGSQYGIWKFEGDTLEICFALPGKPRPADFTPRKGQGHTFTAWKLVMP